MSLPKPTHKSKDGRYLVFKNSKNKGYRVFDTHLKKQHNFPSLKDARSQIVEWYKQEHLTPEQKAEDERRETERMREVKKKLMNEMNDGLNEMLNV